ncbi:PREDICTED: mitochondrial import receptor subunit TOM70 [Dufourea novaeangliae]|uniref:Mitochondrial import receptor subunit TOM70 n=1 Tax=Dufourea novaeangliae TaxID=178035 RepID=A0A154PRM9_DUFNO|nr:PREDICTED: mitochondrial import receptor subunit TOM70 [Dufourea novaeangliae]KZC14004.1 Mitochondrial import receptor subunit TOM70 [Dufourea novaeangliae]
MTGASGAGSVTGSALPKWQLALVVGAPVALGLGYMYFKNNIKPSPKSNRGKSKTGSKENGTPAADKQISIDADCPPKSTAGTETPLDKAQRFKNKGNEHFKIGKYDEAITQYNNAIEACPMENTEALATFYQNRAAAYEQLKKFSAVKADCTKALELKPRYAKALLRRARAMEHCNNLESALEDVTAACILENFGNQTALIIADRVLKQLGKQHAMEHLANKKFIMPSKQVIKDYINSFHSDPIFTIIKNNDYSNVSPSFAKILECVKEEKYDDVIPLCTQELNSSEVDTLQHKMEVHLLRATFYFLLGQHETAIDEFATIINSDTASNATKVNALVKRATLYINLENPEKSFCDYEMAIELDPDCSDIYFYKGQANLLMDKIQEAKEDFKKAVDLNPKFGVAYVQKCYTDYHYALINRDIELSNEAMKGFEMAFEKYPDCPDCYILYAQVLSETQEYQKADSYFAKAIEKHPYNASFYVHRGLLQLKWNGNVEKAIGYIKKGLELDDKCEFGYETLATIEVQRGNLEEAISLFDKALALGRTATELTHIFGLRDAVKAQLALKDKLGANIMMNISSVS